MKDSNTALAEIYTNYINDNLTASAKQIRSLTRIGIVRMMTEYVNIDGGMDIVCNPSIKYDFEQFIMRALEGQV